MPRQGIGSAASNQMWSPLRTHREIASGVMPSPIFAPTAIRRVPSLAALVIVATALVLLAGLLPAAAQAPDDAQLREELERAEQQAEQLSGSLTVATERVDRLTARLAEVRDRADQLRAELADLEAQNEQTQKRLSTRLVAMYKGDRTNTIMAVATGKSLTEITMRSHYLGALARDDRRAFEEAAAVARATEARRAELAGTDAELDSLVAEAAQARDELDAQFASVSDTQSDLEAELARREAEAARLAAEAEAARIAAEQAEAADAAVAQAEAAERRAAAASRSADRARDDVAAAEGPQEQAQPGPAPAPAPADSGSSGGSSSGKVCPQANPRSFTDTWGAPRSGGRSHQGTDIFGARGGNVYAIVSGTVQWTQTGATSGLFLSLRGNDGHSYWYMHLQDFVASPGDSVSAGDLIAHNGDTGNAQGTTPHIHFEYHPGGGGAVNPYPLLRSVCG